MKKILIRYTLRIGISIDQLTQEFISITHESKTYHSLTTNTVSSKEFKQAHTYKNKNNRKVLKSRS